MEEDPDKYPSLDRALEEIVPAVEAYGSNKEINDASAEFRCENSCVSLHTILEVLIYSGVESPPGELMTTPQPLS